MFDWTLFLILLTPFSYSVFVAAILMYAITIKEKNSTREKMLWVYAGFGFVVNLLYFVFQVDYPLLIVLFSFVTLLFSLYAIVFVVKEKRQNKVKN
ncbi:hypothetical protein [Alkalihalobacillus sp. LMS39]|uniref:hypothetical protein n=1 Tax=Alkalihalobacillus sp. LMS39 TaxID=2924032 RepID=UPI001FB45163|nr:hypothetical protein [Alkalihalobacillus sp. LMS39]UOE95819.1 hypothetical protein MM271_09550 [Alkalihalobacillus sp. LMS39]